MSLEETMRLDGTGDHEAGGDRREDDEAGGDRGP